MYLQRTLKGLLLAACFQFLFSGVSLAQVWVNGVDVNAQPDIQYMSVRIVSRFLEIDEVFVLVDYGQENCTRRIARDSCRLLESAGGVERIFRSEAAVLNFFFSQGWALKEAFYRDGGDSDLTLHFLLERRT